jgi:hypothetical protein
MIEEAPNYGEEWSGNYEWRRFGGARKEERWKGSSFWVVGSIASRKDLSNFGGKARQIWIKKCRIHK